jgi:hypothetical protein
MRYDPEAIVHQIHAALERIHPSGSIWGSAPGVEIEIGFDGAVLDLFLDPAEYQLATADELGAGIVSAHRSARQAAISAMRQVFSALAEPQSADESLTVGAAEDGVTVVLRADGFLESVEIAAWLPRRYQPRYVAQLVLDTIREAERELT